MLKSVLRRPIWFPATTAGILLTLAASAAWAAPPLAKNLLPNTTKGYVSVRNLPELLKAWDETQLGRLLDDPVMKPFWDDLVAQLDNKLTNTRDQIGLSVKDLEGVGSGEFSLAVVPVGANEAGSDEAAVVMLIDVTGNQQQAEDILGKATKNLVDHHSAKHSVQQVAGTRLEIYDVPPKDETGLQRRALYFRKDGLLGFSDHIEAATSVLSRFGGTHKDTLAELPAFKIVMQRSEPDSEAPAPHVTWFAEPVGFLDAARAILKQPRRSGPDIFKILRSQGFTAIQGVGGRVNLADGQYGALHRTAIYAPEPYEKAMRMASFPEGGDFVPPSWIPRDVVRYTTFNWHMLNAFDNFGSLFDELFGEGEEGIFEDVVESVATDPNGPQIHIRNDLIAHLGTRASLITDHKVPITPTSKRQLFAAEAKNTEALAKAIEKSMENDPTVERREFGEYTIYEIVGEEHALPELNIDNGLGDDAFGGVADDKEDRPVLPNSAVAVAKGHLFISSHLDLLQTVLGQSEPRQALSRDVDYNLVIREFEKLGAKNLVAQSFGRTDEQMRVTYELFREGKLPGAETPIAQVLDALLHEGEEDTVRKPELDGSKLPDYQVVRRYLGPGGSFVSRIQDGWLVVGFTLSKQTPLTATLDRPAEAAAQGN